MTPAEIIAAFLPVFARQHRYSGPLLFCEEWGVLSHQARADVAIIAGDDLHLVEVKSDADTLTRLVGQEETYSLVADACSLVTGPRHFEKASAKVPPWWGLYRAENGQVTCIRRSAPWNPERNYTRVAELLWQQEAEALASRLGLRTVGRRREVIDRVLRRLGQNIGKPVIDALRLRREGLYRGSQEADERPLLFKPYTEAPRG